MSAQSICKVKAKIKAVKPDGTTDAEIVIPFFFRGSNVYTASTGIQTAALIENIPADKWDGNAPVVPVAELIRAGVLARIDVLVQDQTTKKKRRYELIVDAEQESAIRDNTNASVSLDNEDYILTKKVNGSVTTVNKGKIIKITSRTQAYNP